MFEATKLHEETLSTNKRRYTIRIGNKVPKNAATLAYYFNKKANSEENVLVAEAPKNTVDHITAETYLDKLALVRIDPTVFPATLPYSDDDGYNGIMNLQRINWLTNRHEDNINVTYSPDPVIVTKQESPQIIHYQQDDYAGDIGLMYENYVPYGYKTLYKTETLKVTEHRKPQIDDLPSASYAWPLYYSENGSTIITNDDGYSGKLKRVDGAVSYWKATAATGGLDLTQYKTDANIVKLPKEYTVTVDGFPVHFNLVPPIQQIPGPTLTRTRENSTLTSFTEVIDTQTVTFTRTSIVDNSGPILTRTRTGAAAATTSFDEVVDGHTVHFVRTSYQDTTTVDSRVGLGRWLGNKTYGYNGNSWADDIPKHFEWIYSGAHDKMWHMTDNGGWSYQNGNELWELDGWASNQFQPGNRTGQVWADKVYAANPNNYWPPSGFTFAGNTHSQATLSGSGDPSKANFGDPGSDHKYYTSDPIWDTVANYYYRNVVIFYKVTRPGDPIATYTGQYKGTISTFEGCLMGGKATYAGHLDDGSATTYSGEQLYEGILTKQVQTPYQVCTSWTAQRTYEGVISKVWYDYDGLGFYSGLAVKRMSVGNINVDVANEFLMYPNENGILETELGDSEIESELFYITDMFKDNVPLHYMYKLKLPIYDRQGPDDYGIYQGTAIRLVNSAMKSLNPDKYKWKIKLVKYKPEDSLYNDIYNVLIFTSFATTSQLVVKAIYNAYDDKGAYYNTSEEAFSVTGSKIKPGIIENLTVQPYFDLGSDYNVVSTDQSARRSYIQLVNNKSIPDSRRKIHFHYRIKTTDGVYTSQPISADVINKKFALQDELPKFNGRNYTVSPMRDGIYLSAFDIIVDHCDVAPEDIPALRAKTFIAELYLTDFVTTNNKFKINLFTSPDGSSVVSAETTEDTGFFDKRWGKYNKMISLPGKYKVVGSIIYPAYAVLCRDIRNIKSVAPRETNLLESWYARVQFGHFTQLTELNNIMTRLTYAMPEFNNQNYSAVYGRPYVDVVGETAQVLNEHTIRVKLFPLYIKLDEEFNPTNLTIRSVSGDGTSKDLTVESWSFSEGVINLEDVISENDNIVVDYTYEEQTYVYRGYYDNSGNFMDIEFNPNQYHTYMDNSLEIPERKEVYNLFNSIISFFLKPSLVEPLDDNGNPVEGEQTTNTLTLYHKINDTTPTDEKDLMIGSVYVRHNTSLKATTVIDARTRGGGLIEELSDQLRRELEPESDYYWDIGYWDGEPYTENAVVIIRMDQRILKQYGGNFTTQDVEKAVEKWITLGVIPLIEYVQTYTVAELPQAGLAVTTIYQNKLNYTPTVYISTETI